VLRRCKRDWLGQTPQILVSSSRSHTQPVAGKRFSSKVPMDWTGSPEWRQHFGDHKRSLDTRGACDRVDRASVGAFEVALKRSSSPPRRSSSVTAHCAQRGLTVTERCRPPLKVRSSGHLWSPSSVTLGIASRTRAGHCGKMVRERPARLAAGEPDTVRPNRAAVRRG